VNVGEKGRDNLLKKGKVPKITASKENTYGKRRQRLAGGTQRREGRGSDRGREVLTNKQVLTRKGLSEKEGGSKIQRKRSIYLRGSFSEDRRGDQAKAVMSNHCKNGL